MNVAIDCFKLVKGYGKSIGIYQYAISLLRCLVYEKKKEKNENVNFIIFGNKYNKADLDMPDIDFIEISDYNPLNKIHNVIWELFVVSNMCRRYNIERIIYPRGFSSLFPSAHEAVVIHDLIPFFYKEKYPREIKKIENIFITKRLMHSARNSKRVITISEFSKKDILNKFKIDDRKIKVIYNPCPILKYESNILPDNKTYISAITSGLPHKNADGIIRSYEKYCQLVDHPLGLKIIGISDITKYNLSPYIEKKIECYGYLKDNNQVFDIIANSVCFVFLSLIEGFGLPPIEAMQLNVPVVCSNVSSIPEVVGKSAILVDPMKYDEIAERIRMLVENKQMQNELIKKGKDNVKRFDFESRAKLYWDNLIGDNW